MAEGWELIVDHWTGWRLIRVCLVFLKRECFRMWSGVTSSGLKVGSGSIVRTRGRPAEVSFCRAVPGR